MNSMTLPVSTLADRGIRRLPEGVLTYPWDPETVEATIQKFRQRVKHLESLLITYVDNPLHLSQDFLQLRIAGAPSMRSRASLSTRLAQFLRRTGRRGADEPGEPGDKIAKFGCLLTG